MLFNFFPLPPSPVKRVESLMTWITPGLHLGRVFLAIVQAKQSSISVQKRTWGNRRLMDWERFFTAVIISHSQAELFVFTEAEHLSTRARLSKESVQCGEGPGALNNTFSKSNDCGWAFEGAKNDEFHNRRHFSFLWMQTFIDERLRASLPIYCCKMKSPPFSRSLSSSEWIHPSPVCVPPPSSLSSHSSHSSIGAWNAPSSPLSPSLAREICLTMGGSAQGQIRSHSPRSHSHCFFHPSFSPHSLSPHSFQIISAAHNNNYWGRRRGDKGEAADGREEGRASEERRSVKKKKTAARERERLKNYYC